MSDRGKRCLRKKLCLSLRGPPWGELPLVPAQPRPPRALWMLFTEHPPGPEALHAWFVAGGFSKNALARVLSAALEGGVAAPCHLLSKVPVGCGAAWEAANLAVVAAGAEPAADPRCRVSVTWLHGLVLVVVAARAGYHLDTHLLLPKQHLFGHCNSASSCLTPLFDFSEVAGAVLTCV